MTLLPAHVTAKQVATAYAVTKRSLFLAQLHLQPVSSAHGFSSTRMPSTAAVAHSSNQYRVQLQSSPSSGV